MSHRAVILAGVAMGETRIVNAWFGADLERTAAAMRSLGAQAERDGDGTWIIAGRGTGGLIEPETVLDMGDSGPAAHLLCGLLATHRLRAVVTASPPLSTRPLDRLLAALRATTGRLTARSGGYLPVTIEGAYLPLPLDHRMPEPDELEKAALLLTALNTRGHTRISVPAPTHARTEALMRHFGAAVLIEAHEAGEVTTVQGQPDLRAADMAIPGDLGGAEAIVLAATLVPGSSVTLPALDLTGYDHGLIPVLIAMGARITIENRREVWGQPIGDVRVEHASLRGIEVPGDALQGQPTLLGIAACYASGVTRLRYRHRPGDPRFLDALRAGAGVALSLDGADVLIHGKGGPPDGGGVVATGGDPGLALAGLILGMVSGDPVTVDDGMSAEARFPCFRRIMTGLGAHIEVV